MVASSSMQCSTSSCASEQTASCALQSHTTDTGLHFACQLFLAASALLSSVVCSAPRSVRAQFKDLCAKLDRLSHLHFAPKPTLEDVVVRVEVPALAMEEVAPQVTKFSAIPR